MSQFPIDAFVKYLSNDITIRLDNNKHILNIAIEGSIANLRDIYINNYGKYYDAIENIINLSNDIIQIFQEIVDITNYTISFYAGKNFDVLLIQFIHGKINYLLFSDEEYINYLNNPHN